jgi:hypothetical protein
MGRGTRAAAAHITDTLRQPAQGTPKWLAGPQLAQQEDGRAALEALMARPAGTQPWMKAASRFRGGSAGWQWAPEHMREIARAVEYDADEHDDDPQGKTVFLVGGYDSGQGPGSDPKFIVFEYDFDEIGEREIFMVGAAHTLTRAHKMFAHESEQVTGEAVDIETVRGGLASRLT